MKHHQAANTQKPMSRRIVEPFLINTHAGRMGSLCNKTNLRVRMRWRLVKGEPRLTGGLVWSCMLNRATQWLFSSYSTSVLVASGGVRFHVTIS